MNTSNQLAVATSIAFISFFAGASWRTVYPAHVGSAVVSYNSAGEDDLIWFAVKRPSGGYGEALCHPDHTNCTLTGYHFETEQEANDDVAKSNGIAGRFMADRDVPAQFVKP